MNMELLSELDARSQIHDLYARFCRGFNSMRPGGICRYITPTHATITVSFAGGSEEFADWVIDLQQSSLSASHIMSQTTNR